MPYQSDEQQRIRETIFAWLDRLMVKNGSPEITRAQLQTFEYQGMRINLLDTSRGIRNPAQFDVTLSVMTSASSSTGYSDEVRPDGLIRYSLERGGPEWGSNRKLLAALGTEIPLIYFKGVRPGVFEATYPVYVRQFDADAACVYLEPDEAFKLYGDPLAFSELNRSYIEQRVQVRRHQTLFRAHVMGAYRQSCSVCELRQYMLVDAAHITPDADLDGVAHVSNGLALCKLHHTAYDRDLLGISPEYEIQIRPDLLTTNHHSASLQVNFLDFHGKPLRVPDTSTHWPDRDRLAARFTQFATSSGRAP